MLQELNITREMLREPPLMHVRELSPPSMDIMLVEDNVSDVVLTRRALDTTKIPYNLWAMQKGSDVLPFLLHYVEKNHGRLPDVIMLDLGLPGMDGFEVLEEIASGPACVRAVPIVILTGHEHFDYLSKIYNLWIPAYITKPCSAATMREVLSSLSNGRKSQRIFID